MCQNNALAL
nr:unnamed protein product [Callosobruchus chinensis]